MLNLLLSLLFILGMSVLLFVAVLFVIVVSLKAIKKLKRELESTLKE